MNAAPTATLPVPAAVQHARWVPWSLFLLALWAWAIAGCADEWSHNPLYSYGWFVPLLMIFFAWRRVDDPAGGRAGFEAPAPPPARRRLGLLLALAALVVFPLELFRQELPDDRLNNWIIALLAVGITLLAAGWCGGRALRSSLTFPALFFLSAVPWPKRWENPITIGLQKMVAVAIVEILHLLGIQALPRGTTIHLRNGPVGIAEACSGVRSLQASLMISLAVGELFMLSTARRVLLVVFSALTAMLLNLARTLTLCLLAEYQGLDGMHKYHDGIGDAILLVLPGIVWVIGWLLARDQAKPARPPAGPAAPALRGKAALVALGRQLRSLDWPALPNVRPALAIGLGAFLAYHGWLAYLDFRNPPQQAPFFAVRTGPETGNEPQTVDEGIWAALAPTSGGYVEHLSKDLPGGRAFCYHFFWKPSAANRWVTGHRPDVCMPAGGWEKAGPVVPVEMEIDGRRLHLHAFTFASGDQKALQLWGIWRNGEPIRMDFFDNPTLEWSLFTGKSRSAVEVISCFIPFDGDQPPVDTAVRVLQAVFQYHHPDESGTRVAWRSEDPAAQPTQP